MLTERLPVADGVDLAVDSWSPAGGVRAEPAFLLVHGLASNARLWDGVAERLSEAGHTVATVDLRGHGRSSKPDGPYDVPTVADDLARVIDRLGWLRPVAAGQSWGGNVVLELAVRHPERVGGIVGVDGGWLEPSRVFTDWDACWAALAPPRLAGLAFVEIERHVRAAHPDWPESGIAGTLANFEVRSDGTIAPWLTFDRHRAVLRGLWEHHPPERYPHLACPALLVPVTGDGADWSGRKRADIAVAEGAIPDVRVRWFSGDHDVHAQHPEELAAAMAGFATDVVDR